MSKDPIVDFNSRSVILDLKKLYQIHLLASKNFQSGSLFFFFLQRYLLSCLFSEVVMT